MSLLAPIRRNRVDQAARSGLLRSVRLFRLFLAEQSDPETFYSSLAEDAVAQVAAHGELGGRTVVDVGGGGGWFTAAFRARGANCYLFEPDLAELYLRTAAPAGAVVADGYWLPVRDGGADVVFSSNVLEHVADPIGLIEEMIRATRPGGLVYLSYTNWYSPWGGHEMSPWHLLGAGYAARRYVRRHRREPKHECGVNLFPVHIGPILRAMRARPDVRIVEARPRYYPRWCRLLVRLPGLREVVTWNLMLIMRRVG
ncbi:MAG TPA: class I SAM-dependent methyltransferase [Streptosporangiaceae bacterium]|jgi:SAM-dependent methyltransferase|nr:class I SAM-dependent methyltransferase [Streptosporangiaceae bacterium]